MSRAIGYMSIKTQFDNLGDALINKELAALISSRIPLVVDLTRSPMSFHQTMEIDRLPNTTFIKKGWGRMFLQIAKNALSGRRCYFFLNPGGLGGGVGDSFRAFFSSIVYNLILLVLKGIGVRVCLVGVSFEPMTRRESIVARMRRSICYSFSVRDKESARYLSTIGIDVDDVVPDLSFNLYQSLPIMTRERRYETAFTFRIDRGLTVEETCRFAAEIISSHPRHSRHLVVSQVSRDSIGMRSLHQLLVSKFGPGRIDFLEFHDCMGKAMQAYLDVQTLYSNRLHALLVAAYGGAVPVAVISNEEHRKISSLFNDLGFSPNVVNPSRQDRSDHRPLGRDIATKQCDQLNEYFDRLLLVQ